MLNQASPMPLYQQLADRLSAAIRRGDYPVGERIPSEHALAARYRVGRPTVRQATEVLVRRGALSRRRGSGTFVTGHPRELAAFSMAGTAASFRDQGLSVDTQLLEGVGARSVPADAGDNPFRGEKALFFRRLTRTEDGPALLEETYLDPELFGELRQVELDGRSLSAAIREHYRTEPTGGQQLFQVATASGARSTALELSAGAPVLLIRRHLHFPHGDSAVYSELYCRTDRIVPCQDLGDA